NFGLGSWIQLDLGATKTVCGMQIAWYLGDSRVWSFEVSVSSDGSAFTKVYEGKSSGASTELETYDVPDTSARYVRVSVFGNSTGSQWASITELRAQGAVSSAAKGLVAAYAFDEGSGSTAS